MNNPLQGVLGHLELMIETVEEARPLRRELRRIYHEADRAAKIVRNLMVFTGARRMARRRLRLDRVITRALGSRSAALRRSGIEVVREDAASIPAVIGDPLLLHQAFLNILVNAEHAIAARGGEGRVHVRCFADPARHQVTATIRDTGPDPTEILPRIFDPFFTTKEVGQERASVSRLPTASSRSMAGRSTPPTRTRGAPSSRLSCRLRDKPSFSDSRGSLTAVARTDRRV